MFCWGTLLGAKAREHVFPKWYLERRGIVKNPIEVALYSARFEKVGRRALVLDSLLAGTVCRECNGGWMSSLECKAQPILEPLVKGEGRIGDLDAASKAVLARWTFKTAFATDAATMGPRRVAPWHPLNLAPPKDRLPPRGIVLASISPFDVDAELMEVNHWQGYGRGKRSARRFAADAGRSYKIAMQLGRLTLLAASWPNDRRLFAIDGHVHEIVSPPPRGSVFEGTRPQPRIQDARHFLYNFAASLGVEEWDLTD
jgi:hypothetical protein